MLFFRGLVWFSTFKTESHLCRTCGTSSRAKVDRRSTLSKDTPIRFLLQCLVKPQIMYLYQLRIAINGFTQTEVRNPRWQSMTTAINNAPKCSVVWYQFAIGSTIWDRFDAYRPILANLMTFPMSSLCPPCPKRKISAIAITMKSHFTLSSYTGAAVTVQNLIPELFTLAV